MSAKNVLKILLLEDNPDDVFLIERELKKGGIIFDSKQVDTREEFTNVLQLFKPDIILSDHGLPQFNSMEALKACKAAHNNTPFILVTGTVSDEYAISCIQSGADDYILKSNLSRLPTAIERALKERKLNLLKREARKSLRVQNEHLQKVNKELDQFVYSISHNLRGPLASALGLLRIASSENDLIILKDLLGKTNSSLERLDVTLKEILDYSQNARKEIDYEIIDWRKIISDCFIKLEYLYERHPVTPLIDIRLNRPFYSDPYRLEVIVRNLVSNALIYRHSNREHLLSIEVHVNPTEALLTIRDNGIGIAEEVLPRIFDMFYRGSQQSKGAGLGLYIAKEMVNKLNGTISIQSTLNTGTTVCAKIPNKEAGEIGI